MAIRTSCPGCGKRFSAPEEYLGKRVDCPRCRYRVVVRTADEVEAERRVEEERRRRLEEDRRRLALIEQAARRADASRPYYERFQTGADRVRHHHPGAPSRFLRSRALADWLLLTAWLVLFLALAAIALTLWLGIGGAIASPALVGIALVGGVIFAAVSFVLLKFLAEVAFLLAEVGDRQQEIVQLLLDLRDNTDVPEVRDGG